jgi:hypothetical protein
MNLDDGDDTSIIIDDGSDGDVDTDGGGDDIDAQSLDSKIVPMAAPKSMTKSPAALIDNKTIAEEANAATGTADVSSEAEEEEEQDDLGTATNLPQVGAIAISMAKKSSYRPNLHESMMKLSTSMVERVSGSVIVASQSRLASGSHVGRSLHLTGSLRDALMEQPIQIQLGDSANKKTAASMGASANVAPASGSAAGASAMTGAPTNTPGSTTTTTAAATGTPPPPPVTVAVSLVRTSSGLTGTVALAPATATAAASMVMDASAVSAVVHSGADVQVLRGSSGHGSAAWEDESTGYDEDVNEQLINERGLRVLQRVLDKLTGLDFAPAADGPAVALDVPEQIDRLIKQATSNENLCVCFFGWCPFW